MPIVHEPELLPVASLRPHPRNYKDHPDAQLDHVVASMVANGVYKNVVCARDGTILAGHGVVLAAQKAGIELIRVVRLDLDPDEPAALKVLAGDNEVANLAVDDDRKLTELLREIAQSGDLLGTGFDAQNLAALAMVTRPAAEIKNEEEAAHWVGMPQYGGLPKVSFRQFQVHFKCQADVDEFARRLELEVTESTDVLWFPKRDKEDLASVVIEGDGPDDPNAHECSEDQVEAPESDGHDVPLGAEVEATWTQGGGVPGGHLVIGEPGKKPFITPMRECASIELRESDVVVDIGAYVGTYAIRCARFPVKQVVAYEPTPRTYEVLSRTKLPNLRVEQAAVVGDDSKEVELFVSAGIGVTNGIVASSRKAGSVVVPAVSYVDAVRDATVVKIDVEGAEYGYPIVQPGVRAYVIDFHKVGDDWIAKAERIIGELEASGFVAVIKPDWSNGWTCAGSWKRELPDPGGSFEPMTRGDLCCGCGAPIIGARSKSICTECAPTWMKKHRVGFPVAPRR